MKPRTATTATLATEVRTDLQALGLDSSAAIRRQLHKSPPEAIVDRVFPVLAQRALRGGDGEKYTETLLADLTETKRVIERETRAAHARLPEGEAPRGVLGAVARVLRPGPGASRGPAVITALMQSEVRQQRINYQLLVHSGTVVASLITRLTSLNERRASYRHQAREAAAILEEQANEARARLTATEDDLPAGTLERIVSMVAAEDPQLGYARALEYVASPPDDAADAADARASATDRSRTTPRRPLPQRIADGVRERTAEDTEIGGTPFEIMGDLGEHVGWQPEDARLNLTEHLFAGARPRVEIPNRGTHAIYQVVPAGADGSLGDEESGDPLAVAHFANARPDRLAMVEIQGNLHVGDLPLGQTPREADTGRARIVRPIKPLPPSPLDIDLDGSDGQVDWSEAGVR